MGLNGYIFLNVWGTFFYFGGLRYGEGWWGLLSPFNVTLPPFFNTLFSTQRRRFTYASQRD